MLAFLRTNTSLLTPRPWVAAASSRCLSSSAPRRDSSEASDAEEVQSSEQEEAPAAALDVHLDGFNIKKGEDPRYVQWLNSEGKQFRHAHRSRNWLGGSVVRILPPLLSLFSPTH